MKLTVFDKTKASRGASLTGLRTMSANRRSGAMIFSTAARRELCLQAGQYALLAQDEDRRCDWYVCFSDEAGGFPLRLKEVSSRGKGRWEPNVYFTCKAVADKLLDAAKAGRAATFLIAAKPVTEGGRQWYKLIATKKQA